MAFCILFMFSCISTVPKNKTIKISNVNIIGQGGVQIKGVDGDYVVKVINDKIILPIKLEVIKTAIIQDDYNFGEIILIR